MERQRGAATRPFGSVFVLALLAIPAVLAVGIYFGQRSVAPLNGAAPKSDIKPATRFPPEYFKGWGKPDLAVILTGQAHGYVQPCGCSDPQYGGLTRRYNALRLLREMGWNLAAVDLGDLYPKKVEVPDQAKEKYKTTLRALNAMGYASYGIGELEMRMPLVTGLAEASALELAFPNPLATNLNDANGVFKALGVRQYEIVNGPVKLGLANFTLDSLANEFKGDPNVQFLPSDKLLGPAFTLFGEKKTDVTIALVHGSIKPGGPRIEEAVEAWTKQAVAVLAKTPGAAPLDLVVHVSDFDTPPSVPEKIKGTNVRALYLGHSGKYLGVLGAFRKAGGGFELKYELVSIGPEFATPDGMEQNHPVEKLMEAYAKTVKERDFLKEYKPLRTAHPTQSSAILAKAQIEAKYVGSDRCSDCHPDAFKVWQKTGHSHAYKTLEDATKPSLRHYDPECIVCHVVGFKHPTGFYDPPAGAAPKRVVEHNLKLRDVGCESCHGPGSMHADNPNNKDYYPLINPIKLSDGPKAALALDFFCQKCHDIDNDVRWGKTKTFAQSWQRIAHPTPKQPQAKKDE